MKRYIEVKMKIAVILVTRKKIVKIFGRVDFIALLFDLYIYNIEVEIYKLHPINIESVISK